jgi:hypothetical protein
LTSPAIASDDTPGARFAHAGRGLRPLGV